MATAIREVGVWRQTRTLLLKNYLIKCRTKKSSVQEILFPLFFLFWLILISMMHPNKKYEEVPDMELNSMDKSVLSNLILGYTPATNITRSIMQKVSTDHLSDVFLQFWLLKFLKKMFSPFHNLFLSWKKLNIHLPLKNIAFLKQHWNRFLLNSLKSKRKKIIVVELSTAPFGGTEHRRTE
ncbi:ATP binding cassette subfamily A member 5 [Phyllostomus discolor]|uniref:ATP binding cassette subfamily A member 5 n=1 Tax=Phyllostomus discolor TaxID=89673 RepID=A0A834DTM7_9CHIR|nr:ATP binding cassette subfamily A member 5 [Phyllostomus discolor]